jgi:SAM-dependent methyltransferase
MQGATPWMPGDDSAERKHAPATLRNREPIAEVLQAELPVTGKVLEVASGSGEHCAFFAELFPDHVWQPTDPDLSAFGSIAIWCAGLDNVLPPPALDAASADWPVDAADAVLCINMAHISPWEATLGLVAGAERLLAKGAPLIVAPRGRGDRAVERSVRRFAQGPRSALGAAAGKGSRRRRLCTRFRTHTADRDAGEQFDAGLSPLAHR